MLAVATGTAARSVCSACRQRRRWPTAPASPHRARLGDHPHAANGSTTDGRPGDGHLRQHRTAVPHDRRRRPQPHLPDDGRLRRRRSPTPRPPCSPALPPHGAYRGDGRLFDPKTGDGLDYLRQPIGASDFTATAAYTYDDIPAGQTDYPLAHFSIAHDQAQILPLLREAERLNPRAAHPRHAVEPAGLDEDRRLARRRPADRRPADLPRVRRLPGRRSSRPTAANGVPVDAITRAERAAEPHPVRLSGHRPALVAGGEGHRRPRPDAATTPACAPRSSATTTTGPSTPTTSPPPRPTRPPTSTTTRSNSSPPAAQYIAGIAYHCYSGDPSAMTALHDQFPGQGHLLHRVLGQPVAATPPTRSPTRSSGTPAT